MYVLLNSCFKRQTHYTGPALCQIDNSSKYTEICYLLQHVFRGSALCENWGQNTLRARKVTQMSYDLIRVILYIHRQQLCSVFSFTTYFNEPVFFTPVHPFLCTVQCNISKDPKLEHIQRVMICLP